MLRFKNFLSEAKVSRRNLDKVVGIFKRILERELKTKFYRWGGEDGYFDIKNGIAILLLTESGRGVRINYTSGDITSITLWNRYQVGKKGDYTIELNGLGLTDAGKKLISVIRSPRVGKQVVVAEDFASDDLDDLFEAKRIPPEQAVQVVADALGADAIKRITFKQIKDVLDQQGYNFPGAFRSKAQIVKGKVNQEPIFDLTLISNAAEIEVKGGDTLTQAGSTGVPNEKQQVAAVTKTVEKAVNSPKPNPNELKDPNSMFKIMKDLTTLVARGLRNSLIVYGGPGIGKTFEITETIKDQGLKKGKDWVVIKGKITTSALYQTLFMHRKGTLLVFDDTDSVWKDAEAANLLKAALDSYDERMISWVSPKTINVSLMDDEEKEEFNDQIDDAIRENPDDPKRKLPSEFIFDGKIIFISNLQRKQFDEAVLNRSAKIDMTLNREQMFIRMESILEHLGDKDIPMSQKKEVLDYLKERSQGTTELPSMRTYVAAESLIKSGMPNWKELLEYV